MTKATAAEGAGVPTACSEDVKQPEVFGSFVEQLLDAAAWPQDSAATGMTASLQLYKVQVWKVACQVDDGVDKICWVRCRGQDRQAAAAHATFTGMFDYSLTGTDR